MRQPDTSAFATRTQRRATGLALASLYVLASTVGPLVHLIDHAPDHSHGPPGFGNHSVGSVHSHRPSVSPEQIAIERFRDEVTGHVDLVALAKALGLAAHPHTHADGTTHSHDHGADHHHDPLHHGSGALEHFALALLSPEAPPRVVELPATPLPQPPPLISLTLPPRPERLEIQYAQGPPVFPGS